VFDVRLREWSPDDGDWYVAQLTDPAIQRFTTEQVTTTTEDFQAALRGLSRSDDQAGFAIVDASNCQLAGNIAANLISEQAAEVSYWIAAGFRNRGLASGALKLMLAWISNHWQVQEVVLWTHAENIASQRVAERAGFRYQADRDEMRTVGSEIWPARWYTCASERS
jgi:[ribosomal protein S5]-alanine N-acetyltransferase